jgi:hypothetical protein
MSDPNAYYAGGLAVASYDAFVSGSIAGDSDFNRSPPACGREQVWVVSAR